MKAAPVHGRVACSAPRCDTGGVVAPPSPSAGRLLADTQLRRSAAVFLDAAREAGILVAPIKGLVVSALLYEDPLERPFGDVDVLAKRADVRRIASLARSRNWPVVRDSKSLGTLNVIVPPGIAIDVRSAIGPPGFASLSAEQALARSRVVQDARITASETRLLAEYDQLLILVVDALLDKLHFRSAQRCADLKRAADAWVDNPEDFAAHARAAGLCVASAVVFRWVSETANDPRARAIAAAMRPLPTLPGVAAHFVVPAMRRNPLGLLARVGVRALADSPARTVTALALGAVGTARFALRNGLRPPWERQPLWHPGARAEGDSTACGNFDPSRS
jgi:hypothetical protein